MVTRKKTKRVKYHSPDYEVTKVEVNKDEIESVQIRIIYKIKENTNLFTYIPQIGNYSHEKKRSGFVEKERVYLWEPPRSKIVAAPPSNPTLPSHTTFISL